MASQRTIDYTGKSPSEDSSHVLPTMEKDFYTPEEAYELVMSDVKSIYDLKDAV